MILAFLEKFFLYQKTEDMPYRPRIEKVNLLVDIYNYCISKYQNAHCINQALLLKKKKKERHIPSCLNTLLLLLCFVCIFPSFSLQSPPNPNFTLFFSSILNSCVLENQQK